MKITPIREDRKFKDFVHYICAHGGNSLGATKLNKILWLLDTFNYVKTGQTVTQSKYVRRKNGPCPKRILPALDELKSEGRIAVGESPVGPYMKRDYLSLVEPDISGMSKDEMELAQFLINYVCETHTANSISDFTHDIIWEAAQDGEEIPMEATLAANAGDITVKHLEWADAIINKAAI
jgi:hypothetical protein